MTTTPTSDPRPTIKTTFSELRKHGIDDWCLLENLGTVGYDETIISLMVKYDIFPQTFLVSGQLYVSKSAINMVTNKLLRTQMLMYEAMDTLEDAKTKAVEYLEKNKVKLSETELEDIVAGRRTLAQIVDEKTTMNGDEDAVQ